MTQDEFLGVRGHTPVSGDYVPEDVLSGQLVKESWVAAPGATFWWKTYEPSNDQRYWDDARSSRLATKGMETRAVAS